MGLEKTLILRGEQLARPGYFSDRLTSFSNSASVVFSLPPLLVIAIAVAGLTFGHEGVQAEIVAEIQALVGPQSAAVINGMTEGAFRDRGASIAATVFGVIVLLLSATGAFSQR